MSKTVNMKQRVSRGNFHALDKFSIIHVFATVYMYVEVKLGARMAAIMSASAMYMY